MPPEQAEGLLTQLLREIEQAKGDKDKSELIDLLKELNTRLKDLGEVVGNASGRDQEELHDLRRHTGYGSRQPGRGAPSQ